MSRIKVLRPFNEPTVLKDTMFHVTGISVHRSPPFHVGA